MTDRQHESGSSLTGAASPKTPADRVARAPEGERAAMPASIPAIGFSLLGLASRIESWTTPAAGVR